MFVSSILNLIVIALVIIFLAINITVYCKSTKFRLPFNFTNFTILQILNIKMRKLYCRA